jgi:hypothetical protein
MEGAVREKKYRDSTNENTLQAVQAPLVSTSVSRCAIAYNSESPTTIGNADFGIHAVALELHSPEVSLREDTVNAGMRRGR